MLALFAAVAVASPAFNFYSNGPYKPDVPTPESILNYKAGDRHTTFRDQEVVFHAIAAASPANVREFQYGVSPEGRPLRIYAIGSQENIRDLAHIREAHLRLAQGTGDPASTVPIVWINECIHGDETASFEVAMWTFYNLAASRSANLTEALKNVLVILNPVYNPDGHERYVVYYNSIATGSPDPLAFEKHEPPIVYGRLNHYRIDMNRDRVAFSQPETQAEFAEMLRWNPQVYVDQHGQVASYFFPPEPQSININVDRARNAKWTNFFGRQTGKAFDAKGMSYFVKDSFDLYYPGYLDSSNTLSGAIGMTNETDGGRVLASTRPDGSVLTLRQGMAKHFVSALSVITATSSKREELMRDYAAFKKQVCDGAAAGKFKRVVLTSADARPLLRLKEHLGHAGIHCSFSREFTQADCHDYWTGKFGAVSFEGQVLVVDMAQPQGALAKALLEPQSDYEPEFVKAQQAKKSSAPEGEKYPGPDSSEFYDLTGWSLPYAYDLKAWWCESAPKLSLADPRVPEPRDLKSSSIGYALRYTDEDDALAALDAIRSGARGSVSGKAMRIGGVSYPRGTFLFLAGRNEEGYENILGRVAKERGVHFEGLSSSFPDEQRDSPGSEAVTVLKRPSIAVIMGSGERISQCGSIWFLLEKVFKLPFTFISEESLGQDLSSFTCAIFPNGASVPRSDRFREWLSSGNVGVVLGNPRGAAPFLELQEIKADMQAIPGSLFRASLDMRSFLSFGYRGPEIAVPLEGDQFWTRRKEGGSIIALSGEDKTQKLLTGWEWPDETEKSLKDALFLQDIPIGQGRLVVYAQDPTSRLMWPGLNKTLLNAILIGSGQ